jgi:hypothetical protein
LSAGAPYAVLDSTPGRAKPIFRTVSKLIVLFGMGRVRFRQLVQIALALICWRSKREIADYKN